MIHFFHERVEIRARQHIVIMVVLRIRPLSVHAQGRLRSAIPQDHALDLIPGHVPQHADLLDMNGRVHSLRRLFIPIRILRLRNRPLPVCQVRHDHEVISAVFLRDLKTICQGHVIRRQGQVIFRKQIRFDRRHGGDRPACPCISLAADLWFFPQIDQTVPRRKRHRSAGMIRRKYRLRPHRPGPGTEYSCDGQKKRGDPDPSAPHHSPLYTTVYS